MPKLWDETVDAHRRAVREATLDATAALVAERGLRSVTMTEIAEATGIGRATLYKYFRDVDAILVAWHERQVTAHLHELRSLDDRDADPRERLETVLEAYADIQHAHAGSDVAALLHAGEHVARAETHLLHLVTGLIRDAAETGAVRADVAPRELATYCLHALRAAAALPSKAAVARLVAVTVSALDVP